jgi:hypothetical protein
MYSKSRIISLTLLLSIVLSFALNAINTKDKLVFNDGYVHLTHNQDNNTVNENFVFEETENDTEDFSEDIYFILPFLTFNFEIPSSKLHFVSHAPVTASTNPLFISFRTFRI